MAEMTEITIKRPDDWHLHLRDGAMMAAVLAFTARAFARAIVMPNLSQPVTTTAQAISYRERIGAALAKDAALTPLMTCYLTEHLDLGDMIDGFDTGVFAAAKLYPAGATTNSDSGVTDIANISGVLAGMEKAGMPLLVHGETTDPSVDVFDREAVFIERSLIPLTRDFPGLKVVFEHVTTSDAVEFVLAAGENVAATITVHHLMINRSDMFLGGLRPHLYCLPVAKRDSHRLRLRKAVTSGDSKFFLGTDSAPHPVSTKESDCGCAGIFSAPSALELYTQVFDEEGALDKFEAFASLNGPAFYGLPVNEQTISLKRGEASIPDEVVIDGQEVLKPFMAGETLAWTLVD